MSTLSLANEPPRLHVQALAPEEQLHDVGCQFSAALNGKMMQPFLTISADSDGVAQIRVNDELRTLHQVTNENRPSMSDGHFLQRWRSDDLVVDLDYSISAVGDGGESYVGKVTLRRGEQVKWLLMEGYCGC